MLSRLHRFHGHNSLRYVYSKGKQVRTPEVSLKYAHNDRIKTYRVAVVVSKKVSKSAVVRNRIRRRIYEIVRQAEVQGQYDLVFSIFDETIATMPQPALDKLVHKLLVQGQILKGVSP